MPLPSREPERKSEPRLKPIYAGVLAGIFGLLVALFAFQAIILIVRAQLQADLETWAASLTTPSDLSTVAIAENPIFDIRVSRRPRPPADAPDCVDDLGQWLAALPGQKADEEIARAAGDICASTGAVREKLLRADALVIMRAGDFGSPPVPQVEASIFMRSGADSLDAITRDPLMAALLAGITLSAGLFGYALRHSHYVAYVAVRERANTDGLSGVQRREQFLGNGMDLIRKLREGGGTASLLVLDLDHFKTINDRFGHAAGDEVIRSCGRLLSDAVRDGDVIGRVGGEEFMILLPNLPKFIAAEVADRLRKQMAAHAFTFQGQSIFVTLSTGIASLMATDDIKSLMDRADRRLYRAKSMGRNCVVWEDDETHDF